MLLVQNVPKHFQKRKVTFLLHYSYGVSKGLKRRKTKGKANLPSSRSWNASNDGWRDASNVASLPSKSKGKGRYIIFSKGTTDREKEDTLANRRERKSEDEEATFFNSNPRALILFEKGKKTIPLYICISLCIFTWKK